MVMTKLEVWHCITVQFKLIKTLVSLDHLIIFITEFQKIMPIPNYNDTVNNLQVLRMNQLITGTSRSSMTHWAFCAW